MWNEGCAQKAQIVSCCEAHDKNWGEEIGDPGSPGFDDPAPGGGQVIEGIEGAVMPPAEEPGEPVVFPVNVRIPPLLLRDSFGSATVPWRFSSVCRDSVYPLA
jgi:hypothetical protein